MMPSRREVLIAVLAGFGFLAVAPAARPDQPKSDRPGLPAKPDPGEVDKLLGKAIPLNGKGSREDLAKWRKSLPASTLYFDLKPNQKTRAEGVKELIDSDKELLAYLRSQQKKAAENARKETGKDVLPIAVFRIREFNSIRNVQQLVAVCHDAGFRCGVDLDIPAGAFAREEKPTAGEVRLVVTEDERVETFDGKVLKTTQDVVNYLKQEAPAALKAGKGSAALSLYSPRDSKRATALRDYLHEIDEESLKRGRNKTRCDALGYEGWFQTQILFLGWGISDPAKP
jgi:hypothetical protein